MNELHLPWHYRVTAGLGVTIHNQNGDLVFDRIFELSEQEAILKAVQAVNIHDELLKAAKAALVRYFYG